MSKASQRRGVVHKCPFLSCDYEAHWGLHLSAEVRKSCPLNVRLVEGVQFELTTIEPVTVQKGKSSASQDGHFYG